MMRWTAGGVLTLLFVGVLSECPVDWFDAGSLGCYKFLEGRVNLTWVEAQLTCEEAGGYLAEPQSQLQIEFLSELAGLEGSFTGIGYWYIGLTDLAREGDWLWIHNDARLVDDLWSSSSPSNKTGNSDDCAVMVLKNRAVYWEDHSCTSPEVSHHPVAPVCQADTEDSAPTTTTTPLPTTTEVTCEAEWSEFNGSCYKLFKNDYTWLQAMTSCIKEGSALTSVHSLEEENFLNDLAQNYRYWLGGYPDDDNYTWYWVDYTEFDYSHNRDLDPGSTQCIMQENSYYGSGWDDHSCDSSSYLYYYICKKL